MNERRRRPRVGPLSRAIHRVVRWFVGRLLLPYWQPQIEGLARVPPAGPLLVAANHPTMIDPLFLVVLFPRQLDLLMGRHVRAIPLAGKAFHEGGHVTIGEGWLEESLDRLERGFALGVFPEGRHSYTDQLAGFRTGIALLAKSSGVPVLPIGILGHQNYLAPRAPCMRGGPVRVNIGPPLVCDSEESTEGFTERLRLAVLEQMKLAARPLPWAPDWRFRLLQAFWLPVSWTIFAIVDRIKPDNIR